MAKQSVGYMDGFRGKLGPAVGYMWNGKWCVRSHCANPRNPRSEAQQEHRTLFKQEVQLAARMRWALTTTMTALGRENGMTAYNLFVKVNQPVFSLHEGSLQVDYSRLLLSLGDVPTVGAATAEWSADNVLEVSFERGTGRGFDHVQAYVFVPELGEGFLSAPVYRRDRHVTVALPDEYAGLEAHVYLMAQSDDGRWSESVYAGAVTLSEMERVAKKDKKEEKENAETETVEGITGREAAKSPNKKEIPRQHFS